MKRLESIGALLLALLALLWISAEPGSAQVPEPVGPPLRSASIPDVTPTSQERPPFCCDRKHFGPAAVEMALLEVLPWYFNLHFSDDSTAVLSPSSWWRNIEQGFEWDVDNFRTNMFMHPFHGHAYFNAARTNGYGFWEAAAFPWIGSFLFEFFGENNRPAINDWVSTSASGVVVGEALYRVSRLMLDNRKSGAERAAREIGAFLVNPVGGVNRMVRGEMSRIGPNPADRRPSGFRYDGKMGARIVGDGNLDIENDGASAFAEFRFQYGNPFSSLEHPFDDFLMTVQLNSTEADLLGRLQIEGSLYRTELSQTRRAKHFFGVSLHYDYINNETYEVGGQSIGAGIMSLIEVSDSWSLQTRAQVLGSAVAGVGSEYATETGRSYDFGSGVGLRLYASLYHNDRPLLEALYVGAFVHSLNGASGNHVIHFPAITARIPMPGPVDLGAEFIVATRNSFYRGFANVHRTNPQLRLFASLH